MATETPQSRLLEALIFDMDAVLIDSPLGLGSHLAFELMIITTGGLESWRVDAGWLALVPL